MLISLLQDLSSSPDFFEGEYLLRVSTASFVTNASHSALDCNELCQAVLARSPVQVESVLRRSPNSVNETNVFGQTSLHLSVIWPESLRTVLDAGALVDVKDYLGHTPVQYACYLEAAEQVAILTEANCLLGWAEGPRADFVLDNAFRIKYMTPTNDANAAMVDKVIQVIAQRQRNLMSLARKYLDVVWVNRLQSSKRGLLDRNASLAIHLLEARIVVPKYLKHLTPPNRSVYHNGLTLRQANSLWEAGFYDVDEYNDRGKTPIMILPAYDIKLVKFFLSKGADLHRRRQFALRAVREMGANIISAEQTGEPSNLAAVHELATTIGVEIGSFLEQEAGSDFPRAQVFETDVLRKIMMDPLQDACDCACSDKGCRTVMLLLKAAAYSRPSIWLPHLPLKVRDLCSMVDWLAKTLRINFCDTHWIRSDILRFLTFRELGLQHTCCCFADEDFDYDLIELDDERDRHDIRQEQAKEVETLESLLVEFEAKYLELSCPLSLFLSGYWKKRMREVRLEKHPIDIAGLRSVGVELYEEDDASSLASDDVNRVDELSSDDDEPDVVEPGSSNESSTSIDFVQTHGVRRRYSI